jgi:hypothetical protein
MNGRSPLRAIFYLLLVLAGAAAVGFWAYQAGVQHAIADAGRLAAIPPEAGTRIYVMPWPGPWHGGFFPIFPLIFGFIFLAFLLRGWRGRGGCGPRWRDGVPPAFDEWHRRAHDRMNGAAPPPPERNA